jgi:hypothetical protein
MFGSSHLCEHMFTYYVNRMHQGRKVNLCFYLFNYKILGEPKVCVHLNK